MPLRKPRRWPWVIAVLLLLMAVLAWVVTRWIPSEEELALNASTQLEKVLGVKVDVGTLHWQLLPWPAVVIENVATSQPQPIKINTLRLYPDTWLLLQRRIRIDRADLDGATVPQLSLRGLGKNAATPDSASSDFVADDVPLSRFVFHNVTWVGRTGVAVVYEGDADFDPGWRPRVAHLRVPGAADTTDVTLTRQGQEDSWDTRIRVAGGTANGKLNLSVRDKGRLHLDGTLSPRDIEVQAALVAFNRRSVVSGKASGETRLDANGDTAGELAQSLHTQTRFSMAQAKILRFDLDKAIKTAGKEHAGETPLNSLTGVFDTQNTPQGIVANYTDLKATSGSLTASGKARVANRQVDAEFAVDLVDGIVGVPLKINGPFEDVAVSVPGGAIAGAVIGTAVLPGIGTAIGARIGATVGRIFGSDTPAAPARPSSAPDRKPAGRGSPAR